MLSQKTNGKVCKRGGPTGPQGVNGWNYRVSVGSTVIFDGSSKPMTCKAVQVIIRVKWGHNYGPAQGLVLKNF